MQFAVISDVHANLVALETALGDIDRRGVDAIYCLGDVVGYGPDAAECVDLVRARCAGVVRGNHDEAVAMDRGVGFLPRDAQKAVKQNRKVLSDEQQSYLSELPLRLDEHGCTFVHASPLHPEHWIRIESLGTAMEQFDHFDGAYCFIGHTHLPGILSDRLGVLQVRPGQRYLLNVGSVGQPRDQDPRLAYGIFDLQAVRFEIVRVAYNVDQAVERFRRAGLPRRLGRRLREGV